MKNSSGKTNQKGIKYYICNVLFNMLAYAPTASFVAVLFYYIKINMYICTNSIKAIVKQS